MKDIHYYIQALIDYVIKKELIKDNDKNWAVNQIIAKLKLPFFKISKVNGKTPAEPSSILSEISSWAVENEIIEDLPIIRTLFETDIIGSVLQRPSDWSAVFEKIAKEKGVKTAADWFYEKEKQAYYIKTQEVKKNILWKTKTKYGTLDLVINLSKPEKTPQEIALLKTHGVSVLSDFVYPKCSLCPQNEGFAGDLKQSPRQNLRILPLSLNGERWYLQYSPYLYYNEHCIIFDENHVDMIINEKTFARLLDFLEKFSHYFIGSNADLPIVGGSILNHDHYQGGNYPFALHKAKSRENFKIKKFPKLKCFILDWSMSVIRLIGSKKDVIAASSLIFNKWKNYSDETVEIKAYTKSQRHNTITPIAKRQGQDFLIDLVLRNNRISEESGEGIFHTKAKYHHIKRENIGLIEALGMAILPARLKKEFQILKNYLINGEIEKIKDDADAAKHYEWTKELAQKYKITNKNCDAILRKETGIIFAKSLECCAVFKDDEKGRNAFDKFISKICATEKQ